MRITVGEWWADRRYFFRHQLKNRFRFIKGFGEHQAKEFGDWRRSADARRKTAKRERWAARANAKQWLRMSLFAALALLVSLITAPFRLARWFFRGLNRLRKMSAKEACLEVWYGYRAMIAWGLNQLGYLFMRWRDFPLWLRGISALIILGGVGGLISLPWAIKAAKSYRSEVIFAEAEQLQESGRLVEAYTKARAAALLDRDDPELLKVTAELAKETRNPELVWWSELTAKASGYDPESLAEVVEYACQYRRIRIAARYYQRLLQMYPEHDLVVDAHVRLLMVQGRAADAYALAGKAFAAGNQSPAVHQLVLQEYWRDPEARDKLIAYIDEHIDEPDRLGLGVIHLALLNPGPLFDEGFDYNRVLTAALAHPEITPIEQAMAYGRTWEMGDLDRDEAVQGVYEVIDWQDAESWDSALDLISNFKFYEILEEEPLKASIKRDEALSQLYVEGLLQGENPDFEQVAGLVNGISTETTVKLYPHDRAFWRAILAHKNGDVDGFREELVKSLEAAEEADWQRLNQIALRYLDPTALIEFYSESMRQTPYSPMILSSFLGQLYLQSDDETLKRVLPQVSLQTLRNSPNILMQAIYLKALYGQDLELCRYYAEELVSRFPDTAKYYLVLAFAYAQSNHPGVAKRVATQVPVNTADKAQDASLYFCYAAASGDWGAVNREQLYLSAEQALYDQVKRREAESQGMSVN
ncbi:hypothetical protein [Cerasicoccus frondis]|uniref:hypothetical protein n=1 Tax=Cerasicoccus frondis TaxID=490090 RepID=UPI0028526FDB|nr:hypothetical protein [Cerasicoccus frondis]